MRLVARTTKDPITAIIDTIPRDDHINLQTPILTDPDGKKTINHTGETILHQSGADTLTTYGEALYVSEEGQVHLAGDLELHHDDGHIEPIEGYVDPKPTHPTVGETRPLKALKYAEWIIHSAHALKAEEIDQVTFERVQARARQYARAAGVEEMLDAVLAATQNDPTT